MSRINITVLNLVPELRMIHGEWEREIDAFFGIHRVLMNAIGELDLLLAIEKNDLGINAWCMGCRAFKPCDCPERLARYRNQMSCCRTVNGELRHGQSWIVINQAVHRRLVAARYIKILVEAVRARWINHILLQLFVVNALHCSAFGVKHDAVVLVLHNLPRTCLRSGRLGSSLLQGITPITHRGNITGHEANVLISIARRENFIRYGLLCGEVHDFVAFGKIHFNQAAPLPVERIEHHPGAASRELRTHLSPPVGVWIPGSVDSLRSRRPPRCARQKESDCATSGEEFLARVSPGGLEENSRWKSSQRRAPAARFRDSLPQSGHRKRCRLPSKARHRRELREWNYPLRGQSPGARC